ncbi:class I SAM-dependent rRNA methyltransferase [Persephonella sp.]
MKKVILKKSGEEKLKSYSQWVYTNEIKKAPRDILPGEVVEIFSSSGRFLGLGYYNPLSKIPLRVLTFFKRGDIRQLIRDRIKRAVEKRRKLHINSDAFRIVHSEGDFLPGLIVDYYSGYLSVQINTAGMENLRETIIDVLIENISPEGIIDKSDEKVRKKEGLETENRVIYGAVPDVVRINENGILFNVYLKEGQKTGFYLDQRENRKIVSSVVEGGFSVLDLFSNAGGFGIYAGKMGASYITFVDISEKALEQVRENCSLNEITDYTVVNQNAFDFLKEEVKSGNKYDLIILDPPSFAKTKSEKEGALRGFKYLILNSLKLLKENGYLAVFSCSYHVDMNDLLEVSASASTDTKIPVGVREFMYQDRDHPVLVNMPNTLYLKGLLLERL